MAILAIAHRRNGVGKTTLARHLLTALAHRGLRPLGVDLDPNGKLSQHFGVETLLPEDSIHAVLTGASGVADVAQISRSGVVMCPAHPDLGRLEGLGKSLMVVTRLKRSLSAPGASLDGVVIDCGTRLDVATLNALFAADLVLIPVSGLPRAVDGAREVAQALDALGPVFKQRRTRRYVLFPATPASDDESDWPEALPQGERCATRLPALDAEAGDGTALAYDALLDELLRAVPAPRAA